MRALASIALVSAACGGDAGIFGEPPEPAPAATVSFARTAIIGASVSYGMAGGPLDHILEGRLPGAHEVENLADLYTFMRPNAALREQIEKAAAFRPSAALALDALFWCVYGPGSADHRRRKLEACLADLSRIEAPLFVGDVPDMSGAAAWMLPPDAVPPPAELEALNQEIHRWVEGRPNARLIPLASWNGELRESAEARSMMSPDRLHPNRAGVVYLVRRIAREVDGAGALGAI